MLELTISVFKVLIPLHWVTELKRKLNYFPLNDKKQFVISTGRKMKL